MLAVLVLGAAAFSVLAWQRVRQPGSPAAERLDGGISALRVRFGVTDADPRPWDGTLSVTGGEVVRLRSWRPRPGESIQEPTSWKMSTVRGPNFQWRAWEAVPAKGADRFIEPPGLIVDVRASASTVLQFNTKAGAFEVKPFDVEAGTPLARLGGAVLVDRVPAAEALSDPAWNNEFPAVQAGPDGQLFVAWVAWRDGGNQVQARRFDGRSWNAPQPVSGPHDDIYRVALGRDGQGRVWAVWSAQVGGNWDLYARRFEGGSWAALERLTDAPQPDLNPRLATASEGTLWLVWQAFRNGKSDVLARRHDGQGWSEPETVSASAANDWDPAIATDSQGRVHVAWDSYDKGNYDVLLRTWQGGQWSAVAPIANTPKFEAHVSLACDSQNRLWAAWNESGTDWGKDTGFVTVKQGTRLYEWRSVGVALLENGAWREPLVELDNALPAELRGYNDLPQLHSDGAGRVWLFFRHRRLRIRDTHSETPAHRAAWETYGTTYEGSGWRAPIAIPFSQGRTEAAGDFTRDDQGGLYAAWSTDNRDSEDFLFRRAEVFAGRIPLPPGRPVTPVTRARVQPQIALFPVHLSEDDDLKRIRGYSIESGGRTYRIYRGDTHRHTEFSMDGNNDGSLLEAYRYALDAADMDYLAVSEHNGLGGPDEPYINFLLQQRCDVFHIAGRFVPLYAYERSVAYPNGHRNVIFARRGNPTLPIPPEEAQARTGAKALYEYLKKYQGIAISHTSASLMGTDWRDNDPEVEPLVEIYQGDRVSSEYEGAPKAAHKGNPASAPGGFRPAGYVWNAWAKGYKLGVQVASDHLSTHISYGCTIAEDFTREGLLGAMRQRHSYGATDNIVLDFRLQAGGREFLQGDIVTAAGEARLWVKVLGTQAVRQIDVVRNNRFIHTLHPLEQEVSFTFVDAQPPPGESYYYVRVIQADDNMAWSSPIWVKR